MGRRDRLKQFRPTLVAWVQNSGLTILQSFVQLLCFLLLAKVFASDQYSLIVGASAVTMIAVECFGLGTGEILVKEVSRTQAAYKKMVENAVAVLVVTFIPSLLSAVIIFVLFFSPQNSIEAVIFLITGELLSSRLATLFEQVSMVHSQLRLSAILRMVASVIKLILIAIFIIFIEEKSILTWSVVSLMLGVITFSGYSVALVAKFGVPSFHFGSSFKLLGVSFAGVQIIRALQNSIDKLVIGSLMSPALFGTYGVASRLYGIANLPISTALKMTYPHFFKTGLDGPRSSFYYFKRVMPFFLLLGVTSSAVALIGAFLLEKSLDESYEGLFEFALLMAPIPIFYGLQNALGDVLTGCGRQKLRLILSGICLLITIVTVYVGGALFGHVGAIYGYVGSLASQLVLVLISVLLIVNKE